MRLHNDQTFRHELKYLISVGELQMLRNRIHHLIPLDTHVDVEGTYTIRSLYFGD